jgi:hypothetical protein
MDEPPSPGWSASCPTWADPQNRAAAAALNEFEQQVLASLLRGSGTPAAKQRAALENVIGRLVRTPLRIRF